jgi:hypothetical protein
LKQNVREEISPNMLQRVMQKFQKRLGERVNNKGHYLTDTTQEVNVVIKMLWVKDNFSTKFT